MKLPVIELIKYKYPDIQRVSYWETKYDGSPHKDFYDGLVWENPDIAKPSRFELLQWWEEYSPVYNEKQIELQRLKEYPSPESLVVALWKQIVENDSTEVQSLQEKRLDVQEKYSEGEV